MIQKSDNNIYLNINEISVCSSYSKVCYVQDVKARTSVMEKGYYVFFVKDENANIVAARKFDVEDFVNNGFDAFALKHKPVRIVFTADLFRDQWSLRVETIELWDGPFDASRFIGVVPALNTGKLCALYSKVLGCDYVFPSMYSEKTLSKMCQGRIGGIAKVFSDVTTALVEYKDIPNVDLKDLLRTFVTVFPYYVKSLQDLEDIDVLSPSEEFSHVQELYLANQGDAMIDVMLDTLYALLNRSKPKHLYAHLITQTLNCIQKNLNMCYANSSLSLGASTNVEGVELIRY